MRSFVGVEPLRDHPLPRLVTRALGSLPASVQSLVRRAPALGDPTRWQSQVIGGQVCRIARPVTFTPYAAAQACSARCTFCSENLRLDGVVSAAALLRPGEQYFEQLAQALSQLRGLEMGYSLSGLEFTDNPRWMLRTLEVLQAHESHGRITEKVLYTNTSGFASSAGPALIERLRSMAVGLEVSRHSNEPTRNQAIMRFRSPMGVSDQGVFESALRGLAAQLELALVCIVQRGGVEDADQVLDYLTWARSLGIRRVVFREYSQLSPRHILNATARHIAEHRVAVGELLASCLKLPALAADLELSCLTDGYYFWNLTGSFRELQVTFEASDYETMLREHASGRIYKLVFHANGNLCAGWNPETDVLWSARGARHGAE